MNLLIMTVRKKETRGTSLVIHSFNRYSIVKKRFIETGAWFCHAYVISCIRSFRSLITQKLWPGMIFFAGYPSISPSFSLETWTVLETLIPSWTEIADIMQREHNRNFTGVSNYMIITPLAPEHRRHLQRNNNKIL